MIRARHLFAVFGRFWWGFLVGENPDALVGTFVVIASAIALRHERVAAVVVLPLLVLVILVESTYRGRMRTPGEGAGGPSNHP